MSEFQHGGSGSSGSGGAPSGAAGGELAGTYPNPTVKDAVIDDANIVAGGLTNAAIATAAAIAKTKISGTAVTAADTGTVTSTMIADGTIVTGDLNAAAGITNGQLAGSILQGTKVFDESYYMNGSQRYRESFNRKYPSTVVTPAGFTTGTMVNTAIVLYAGDVVTNLTFIAGGTAEATGTHCWVALYDTQATPALVSGSQSTDQTGAGFFSASAVHTMALGTPFTVVTSGVYYASLSITAGTMPTLVCSAVANTIIGGAAITGQKVLASVSGSALAGTAPATIASPTTVVSGPYCVAS
jgi:hypothetical protein